MAFLGRFVLSAFVIASVSCTRDVSNDLNLNLSIPTSYSSMALSSKLKHVIINMRPSMTATQVSEFSVDFGENGPTGSTVSIVVPGDRVPKSPTLFVQYLGIFEGNGLQLYYGFAQNIDSTISGDIRADIVATLFGTSGQFGRVSGRYLPAAAPFSGSTGPTGLVSTYFKPPTVGHPPILIERSDMFEGWFNLIALSGAPFKHEVLDITTGSPITVFGGPVNLASFPTAKPSIGKIIIPSSYRREGGDDSTDIRQDAENVSVFGFFGDGTGTPTVTVSGIAGKLACYPDGPAQIVPRLYADPAASVPVIYDVSTPSDITRARIATGYGKAMSSFCTLANMNSSELFANADWLMEGHDGATGISAPFAPMNYKADYRGFAEYLKINVTDDGSGNAQANLSWKYLPGISTTSVSGASIYMKSGSMNGGNRDELTCDQQAAQEGYTLIQNVTGATTMSATVSTNLSGLPFTYHSNPPTSTDIYNHSFMLCPYRIDAVTGAKRYAKSAAWSSCMGGQCGEKFHFGLTPPNVAASLSSVVTGAESLEIAGTPPVAIAGNSTTVYLASAPTTIVAGDEVIIRITGVGSDPTSCGTTEGNPISGPRYLFARVLGTSSAPPAIVIASGSWVDGMSTAAGFQFGYVNGNLQTVYCSAHVTRVPHFGSATVTSLVYPTGNFQFDSNWDGMVAFRVSGILTFNNGSGIMTSGYGYQGSPFNYGMGLNLEGARAGSAVGGGGGAHAAVGGDGAGNAGSGDVRYMSSYGDDVLLSMGSSGGGVNTQSGGAGGGTVFISAKSIVNNNSSISISADGFNGTSNGSEGSGGGAAGSINIYAKSVSGTMPLQLSASGGWGSASSAHGGGGGSAGIVSSWFCPSTLLSADANGDQIVANIAVSAGMGGSAAVIGSNALTATGNLHIQKAKACP